VLQTYEAAKDMIVENLPFFAKKEEESELNEESTEQKEEESTEQKEEESTEQKKESPTEVKEEVSTLEYIEQPFIAAYTAAREIIVEHLPFQ
jgi:hypothetical protein